MRAAPPGAVFAGVRFRPGAGGPALGLPLSELLDTRVAADDVRPGIGRRLAPELDPGEALRRLAALAEALVREGRPDPAVGAAAHALASGAAVERVAGAVGLSERQLRRRCGDAVGYGPKTLQRVLRFRRFLALGLRADGAADLAGLALEAGYADQAHLTRECTRLAGLPPARLLAAQRRQAPSTAR